MSTDNEIEETAVDLIREAAVDPLEKAASRAADEGLALPLSALRRLVGRSLARVLKEEAYCLVVVVRSQSWVHPVARAARLLGPWKYVLEEEASVRPKELDFSDLRAALARGGRAVAVVSGHRPIPPALLATADLVVEFDKLEAADIKAAIKLCTGRWVRGLSADDLRGLDLPEATAAIRPGSTPASCLSRIRNAGSQPKQLDTGAAAAPPLEEMHGYGAAAEWALRLVEDLDRWRNGELDFSELQRTAVLSGAPGVGKSSFVKSLARSAGIPLHVCTVGTLFGTSAGYLDSIVKAIDRVFSEAAESNEPAIVFWDELEGFPSRENLDRNGGNWWTTVITHMLTTLDRLLARGSDSRLIIVGATNFPKRLDPALVRAGRFERIFEIDLPDEQALERIYRQHLGMDLPDADRSAVAAIAVGQSGADVVGHIGAARAFARQAGRSMSFDDLLRQISPPSKLSPEELWRTCVHEAGHVVAAEVMEIGDVKCVSVAGGSELSAGRTKLRVKQGLLGTEAGMRGMIVHLLAGRAAEQSVLGEPGSGAGGTIGSDLGMSTALIAAARLSYGMRESLTYVSQPETAIDLMRKTPELVRAVENELREIYAEALALVESHRDKIVRLAQVLLEKRVLSYPAIVAALEEPPAAEIEGYHA